MIMNTKNEKPDENYRDKECICTNPVVVYDRINKVLRCSYCQKIVEDSEAFT